MLRQGERAIEKLAVRILGCVALTAAVLLPAPPAPAAPGDLDPSFGTGGVVEVPWQVNDVAVQPDGRIVAVGEGRTADDRPAWVVGRFLADGRPDPSFATDGELRTRFEGNDQARARAVVVQPDGRIVVGGWAFGGTCPLRCFGRFALTRYLPDGSLDPSFSGDGREVTDLGGWAHVDDLELSGNRSIVAGGELQHAADHSRVSFALARYLPEGGLDPGFGEEGLVITDFDGFAPAHARDHRAEARALVIEPDGRIVAAGGAGYSTGSPGLDDFERVNRFALARYRSDGSLDPSFGQGGRVTTALGAGSSDFATGLVRQWGGRLVAAGSGSTPPLALVRYLPSGALDPSFAGDGIARSEAGSPAGLILGAEGRLVAAGSTYTPWLAGDFMVARFTANGAPDLSFGEGGSARTDITGRDQRGRAIATGGDGKLVVAGAQGPPVGPTERRTGVILRYLAAPGPHDADADGVADAEDLCPLAYGPPPDGCPTYHRELTPLSFDRRLGKGQWFRGRVISHQHLGCRRADERNELRLFKRRRGPDRLIATANSEHPTRFGYRMPTRGRYYLRVPRFLFPAVGHCSAARSAVLRLERNQRIVTRPRWRGRRLFGRVRARVPRCVRGQRIRVTRYRNNRERPIARTRTNSRGRFTVRIRRPDSYDSYFAIAQQNRRCARAKSAGNSFR